jgi:hypothetical protein
MAQSNIGRRAISKGIGEAIRKFVVLPFADAWSRSAVASFRNRPFHAPGEAGTNCRFSRKVL